MARRPFGGGTADFVARVAGGAWLASPNAVVTFWTAVTGGTAVTDLLDGSGAAVTSITTDSSGQLPPFQGPADGTALLWVDGGGPARQRLGATDTASRVATLETANTALPATYVPQGSEQINVLNIGAKGDVLTITDAAITSGQSSLSRAGATKFSSADVGKVVQVVGAGAAYNSRGAWAATTAYAFGDLVTYLGITFICGVAHTSGSGFTINSWMLAPANSQTLMATISSVTSGVATLSASAGTTVSAASCVYGTDDSPVLTALGAGNYFFPGGRSYFLADWFLSSDTTVSVGPNTVFKLPSYPTTDVAAFRLLTSNRSLTTYLEDIHLYGRIRIDMTELTPPSGTIPRGVHVLNCRDFSIQKLFGRGLPGTTGNVLQLGANSGGAYALRGSIGDIRNDKVRGIGSSCAQHTGGQQISYGNLTCDGGLAFRLEMDNNAATTDTVTVNMAQADGGSGFANAAVFFSPHANVMRNVKVASVLASGGADGIVSEYTAGGSISDSTVERMRVTGGGRGHATSGNNVVFNGLTIRDSYVESAVAVPALRSVAGSLGAVSYAVAPGMTLDNCRAKSGAAGGFADVFQTIIPVGSRATLINPVADSCTGPGIQLTYTEKATIHGGKCSDANTSATPITAQMLPSTAYTGTLANWATAAGASAVSGTSGVLTVTAAGGSVYATGRTANGNSGVAIVAGHFYRFSATAKVGTAPTASIAQLILWYSDSSGTFINELDGPTVVLPSSASSAAITYSFQAPAGAAYATMLVRFFNVGGTGNLTAGWTCTFSSLAMSELSALPTQTFGLQADTGVTVDYYGTDLTGNATGPTSGAGVMTSH
jgi:hypothetical protein